MKKLLAALVALFLASQSVFATDVYIERPFKDVPPTHANAKAISFLQYVDAVTGYSDGSFKPGRSLSRSEFVTLLIKTLGILPDLATARSCYPDVTDEWFAPYVCTAKSKGYLNFLKGETFLPERAMTQSEAVAFTVMAYEFTIPADAKLPTGVASSHWAAAYYRAATTKGVLFTQTQRPNFPLTRAQGAELLYRSLAVKVTSSATLEMALSKGDKDYLKNAFLSFKKTPDNLVQQVSDLQAQLDAKAAADAATAAAAATAVTNAVPPPPLTPLDPIRSGVLTGGTTHKEVLRLKFTPSLEDFRMERIAFLNSGTDSNISRLTLEYVGLDNAWHTSETVLSGGAAVFNLLTAPARIARNSDNYVRLFADIVDNSSLLTKTNFQMTLAPGGFVAYGMSSQTLVNSISSAAESAIFTVARAIGGPLLSDESPVGIRSVSAKDMVTAITFTNPGTVSSVVTSLTVAPSGSLLSSATLGVDSFIVTAYDRPTLDDSARVADITMTETGATTGQYVQTGTTFAKAFEISSGSKKTLYFTVPTALSGVFVPSGANATFSLSLTDYVWNDGQASFTASTSGYGISLPVYGNTLRY